MSMARILIMIIIALIGACPSVSARKAQTYVVVAGLDRYINAPSLHRSEKDAKDFAAMMKSKPDTHVALITGKYATHSFLLKALESQFTHARAEDEVIFFFTGHGIPGGLCPYDTNEDGSNALSYKKIGKIMKKSKAKRKIIIADACYSGSGRTRQRTGNSNPMKKTGVILFMSSRGNETSMELGSLPNSLFTYHLLQGIDGKADANDDKRVTAKEIFRYVSPLVIRDSEDQQHPVMWGNFDDNFVIMNLQD